MQEDHLGTHHGGAGSEAFFEGGQRDGLQECLDHCSLAIAEVEALQGQTVPKELCHGCRTNVHQPASSKESRDISLVHQSAASSARHPTCRSDST